ncbi:hypothetical protein PQX77_002140 [Marasmius sp. AFHP31]|nr:hypothetical protein PQX77_002140 [Marasmius sp. AFHP31]
MGDRQSSERSTELEQPDLPSQPPETIAASSSSLSPLLYSTLPHLAHLPPQESFPHPKASTRQEPEDSHPPSSHPTHADVSAQIPLTATENVGDFNRTINGSHVYKNCSVLLVRFPNASPSATPDTDPIPNSSQTHILSDKRGFVSSVSDVPAPTSSETQMNPGQRVDYTLGQHYGSLLSTGCRGYALWKPSPRCTGTGKEHIISIGDVGVCYDIDPFRTFFNITKDLGGIAGVQPPDGVDPPCIIQRNDMTVDPRFHEEYRLLVQPKASILQRSLVSAHVNKIFTLKLSAKPGALLMLPHGAVLRKLEKTSEFKRRILRYWREWYEFADEEGDLDETQTLCLVTGVEQCSTWAMAVWDSTSTNSNADLDSLVLAVAESSGCCSWQSFPLRATVQSSAPIPLGVVDEELKETVFIRAFWISRSNGSSVRRPFPPPPDENGNSDEDFTKRRGTSRGPSSNPRAPNSRSVTSQNPLNPSRNESSSDSSYPAPVDYHDLPISPESRTSYSSVSSSEKDPINGPNIIDLSQAAFSTVSHPCQSINMLAFEIVSKAKPSMLDVGCVAFSHDEDWMSVLRELNEPQIPEGNELLKKICEKFKFVADGDVIHTERMSSAEYEFIRQSPGLASDKVDLIPVLFHLREPDASPEPELQRTSTTTTHVIHTEQMSSAEHGFVRQSPGLASDKVLFHLREPDASPEPELERMSTTTAKFRIDNTPPQLSSKRVLMACTECRKRKVRCNPDRSGVTRPCERCSRNRQRCRYEPINVDPELDSGEGIKLYDPYAQSPPAHYPSPQRAIACTECHKRKVRCNPGRSGATACEQCQSNGLECRNAPIFPNRSIMAGGASHRPSDYTMVPSRSSPNAAPVRLKSVSPPSTVFAPKLKSSFLVTVVSVMEPHRAFAVIIASNDIVYLSLEDNPRIQLSERTYKNRT